MNSTKSASSSQQPLIRFYSDKNTAINSNTNFKSDQEDNQAGFLNSMTQNMQSSQSLLTSARLNKQQNTLRSDTSQPQGYKQAIYQTHSTTELNTTKKAQNEGCKGKTIGMRGYLSRIGTLPSSNDKQHTLMTARNNPNLSLNFSNP